MMAAKYINVDLASCWSGEDERAKDEDENDQWLAVGHLDSDLRDPDLGGAGAWRCCSGSPPRT